MVFVILQIRCAARVLKLWYSCSVSDTSSIADVYTNYNLGVMNLCQKSARIVQLHLKWARIAQIWNRSVEAVRWGKLSAPRDSYVKFSVSAQPDGGSVTQEDCPCVDTFALMMQASRWSNVLPWKWHIAMPKKSWNWKWPHWFFEEESAWLDSIVCTTVWRIVHDTLADVLWYIDGNHRTLSESGHGVPAMFETFHKYNQPENRKRKKKIEKGKRKRGRKLTLQSWRQQRCLPIHRLCSIWQEVRTWRSSSGK